MKKNKAIEHTIQSQIFEYLAYSGHKVWRNNVGCMRQGNRFIRFGIVGAGDLLSIKNGQFYSWEIKKPGGRTTEAQELWKQDIIDHGGHAVIVTNLDEVIKFLKP